MSDTSDFLTSKAAAIVILVESCLGAVLTLLVLLTVFLSPTVHRSAVAINVYITLFIFSISSLVLPIAGDWYHPNPPFGSCIVSAISLYASFPLCAASILALSISLWMGVFQFYKPSNRKLADCCLIIIPYVMWAGIMIEGYVYGTAHKDEVVRQGYPHCSITGPTVRNTSHLFMGMCPLPALIFQGFTLYRLLHASKPFNNTPEIWRTMRDSMIRLAILSMSMIAALILIVTLDHWSQEAHSIINGLMPLSAILTLGTQKDIFRAWGVWLSAPFAWAKKDDTSKWQLQSFDSDMKV